MKDKKLRRQVSCNLAWANGDSASTDEPSVKLNGRAESIAWSGTQAGDSTNECKKRRGWRMGGQTKTSDGTE